jgi:dTDP-4-amino-4,6-dideoxygalactose transaminase
LSLNRYIVRVIKLFLTPRLNLFFFGKQNRASLKETLTGVYNITRLRYSIVEGPDESFVRRAEDRFANLLGFKYAIATGSGGISIQLALRALDLPSGSNVAIQHDTCVATAEAVIAASLTPLFIKTYPNSFRMDLQDLTNQLENFQVAAIIATHLAGGAENITEMQILADKFAIPLLEDSCLSLIPSRESKFAKPNLKIISFGFSKPISVGEGGIILTDNKPLATKISELRHWGTNPLEGRDNDLKIPSWNGRISYLLLELAVSKIETYMLSREILLKRISKIQETFNRHNLPIEIYRGSAAHFQDCGFNIITFQFLESVEILDVLALRHLLTKNGFSLIDPTFPSIPNMTLFSQKNWEKYFLYPDQYNYTQNYSREYDAPTKQLQFFSISVEEIMPYFNSRKLIKQIKSWKLG